MSFANRSPTTRNSTQGRETAPETPNNPFKSAEDAAKFLQKEGYIEITRRASEFDLALMIEQVGVALSDLRDARAQVKALYAIAYCIRTKTHASILTDLSKLLERSPLAQEERERRNNEEWNETRDMMKKLVETTETSAKNTVESIRELTTAMNNTIEKISAIPPPPPVLAPPSQPTYANAARPNGPAAPAQPTPNGEQPQASEIRPPPQLAHRHVSRCQILLDWNAVTAGGRGPPVHTEEEWKRFAVAAVGALPLEDNGIEEKPLSMVRAISKLRNGGVVIELSNESNAKLIRDNSEAFCHTLPGGSWMLKECLWAVRVKFVPVSFDPTSPIALLTVVDDSGLPAGSLASAKWMKNPENRHSRQTVTHLILKFRTPESANHAIQNDVLIAAKRLQADLVDPEPLRCLHCQLFYPGHLAANCPNPVACGHCGHVHPTDVCPNAGNPHALRCINCKKPGHASWDRNCPKFKQRSERLRTQRLSSSYKYHVTEEQWTWQTLWDEATRACHTAAMAQPQPPPQPLPPLAQHQIRPPTVVPAPIPHTRGQNIYSTTQRRRAFINGRDFIRMGDENQRRLRPGRQGSSQIATGANAVRPSTTQRNRQQTLQRRNQDQSALEEFGFTNPSQQPTANSRQYYARQEEDQTPSEDDLYV